MVIRRKGILPVIKISMEELNKKIAEKFRSPVDGRNARTMNIQDFNFVPRLRLWRGKASTFINELELQ